MTRQTIRFYGTLAASFLYSGVFGGLLGWLLLGHPILAAVTVVLVIVGGAPVWAKWR